MKKSISALVLIIALVFGNVAIAQAATPSPAPVQATSEVNTDKSKLNELAEVLQTIRDNHVKINKLRDDAKAAYEKAKNHVQELRQNKDNLTPEQIKELKAALANVKQDRQALKGTQGDIARIMPDLKEAKQDKDIAQAKFDMKSIIDVQNTRIADLRKLIDDLNRVANV